MASDETPPGEPKPSWLSRTLAGRTGVAVAAAVVAAAFGGGYVTAKATGGLFGPTSPTTAAQQGVGWSLFGKPRGANAARRGIPKPEGFAVWRSRIDTSRPEPQACLELTR